MIMLAYTVFLAALSYTSYIFYFPDEIDGRLVTMSEQYVIDARQYGLDVDLNDLRYMGVADLPDGLAGFGLSPHVLLTEEYMSNKEVLYHELTHSLGRCFGHVDSDNGYSIMSRNSYVEHLTWEEAVKKLFTQDIYEMNCNFKGMTK